MRFCIEINDYEISGTYDVSKDKYRAGGGREYEDIYIDYEVTSVVNMNTKRELDIKRKITQKALRGLDTEISETLYDEYKGY